jgi:SOS-response transcriptional repressor LexA
VIVYQASKRQFVKDTFQDDIEAVLAQQFLRSTGHQPLPAEFNAWTHALFEEGEVLKDPGILDDMDVAKVLPLQRVSAAERAAGMPAVPVVDLKFAAGHFSEPQALEEGASDWVALPEWVKPQPGLFVAQVVGESMNKRIPSGAWCLFRAHPQGTRNGKIVVVQHRSISDPETGGSYTIKRYRSEKVAALEGGVGAGELFRWILSPHFER